MKAIKLLIVLTSMISMMLIGSCKTDNGEAYWHEEWQVSQFVMGYEGEYEIGWTHVY